MIRGGVIPGRWIDVYNQGSVRVVDEQVVCDGAIQWTLPEPDVIDPKTGDYGGSLYLRCARYGASVVAICQGQSGTAWMTRGMEWVSQGGAFGQNAVLVRVIDGRLHLWVLRGPTVYTHAIDGGDWETVVLPQLPDGSTPNGGFLDYRHGQIVLCDYGRIEAGLVLPNEATDLLVGQLPDDPPRLAARFQGGPLVTLFHGDAKEPHVALQPNGDYLVCARSTNNQAILLTVRPPFAPDPVDPDPPPPDPPPPPPPEPTPVPESLLNIVQEMWEKYGRPKPEDNPREVAALLNEVAWRGNGNSSEGPWGLNEKPNGGHIESLQGPWICEDILHHRPTNQLYDVLGGSDFTPQWGVVGEGSNERPWLAPIAPEGDHEDPDPPPHPPNPPQPDPDDSDPLLTAMLSELKAIRTANERIVVILNAAASKFLGHV